MTFQETLDYLYQRLPIFQRQGAAALKPNLENTHALLDYLGNPERQFRSIHVAGTNGKGTSCHALSSIMQEAGYKTGLYTSPHLLQFTERIRLNGVEVPTDWVAHFVRKIRPAIEQINPSFFEVTVAMAFEYFAEQKVDIAIIETGLGGRLDSTNVITPLVSLITNIGNDHRDLLGDTLEQIASEKAGIIKTNVPVVIGCDQPDIHHVFVEKARRVGAPVNSSAFHYQFTSGRIKDNLRPISIGDGKTDWQVNTDVLAEYFVFNLPGILEVINELRIQGFGIEEDHIRNGLCYITSNTGLKGRFQILKNQPLLIADVSHNVEGVTSLMNQVANIEFHNLHVVYGAVKDKSIDEIISIFPETALFYFTESSVPRSMSAHDLKTKAQKVGHFGDSYTDVNSALKDALHKAHRDDLILVTGSTFVIAEIEGL